MCIHLNVDTAVDAHQLAEAQSAAEVNLIPDADEIVAFQHPQCELIVGHDGAREEQIVCAAGNQSSITKRRSKQARARVCREN